jgi:L-cysteine S-thiosulfotransferase
MLAKQAGADGLEERGLTNLVTGGQHVDAGAEAIDARGSSERQEAPALRRESKELLGLAALIARQSRGLPIESNDDRFRPFIEGGRAIFNARQGQLNLACAQCHDDNWGQKLAGITLSQGHPTGYPLYRLEWQTLGSLQRRLRNCMIGMRAESYAYGSPEFIALETFLMWRARGMPMESPAVRP